MSQSQNVTRVGIGGVLLPVGGVTMQQRHVRRNRALAHRQAMLCLWVQGYVIDGADKLDMAGYRAALLKRAVYRMEIKTRPYNRGNNAARAADIVRLGPASRWWGARASKHHSGDDKRGIVWYLAKWKREHGIVPRAA